MTDTLIERDDLIALHALPGNEKCLDIADKPMVRLTDEQAKVVMVKATGCENASDFQRLTPINRDKAILRLRKSGLSLRQISRLTGVSIMIIRRVIEVS